MRLGALPVVALVAFLAGCGGSDDGSATLRDGVYEFQLTEDYLLANGIPPEQAANESGIHETTLDAGSFVDSWRTETGATGSCRGTYDTEGSRVTFRWSKGCFGDWAMEYEVVGDVVTWSDFEALPPYDGEQEQRITEVFNGVPWTRTGDVPEEGEN